MPVISGTLADFVPSSMNALTPRIKFKPNGPSFSQTGILASRPIEVIPDQYGIWSVTLRTTTTLFTDAWYTVQIEWLDVAGNYIQVDSPDWEIRVGTADAEIGAVMTARANPLLTWVALTPPPKPSPGTWWLEMNPNDPNDPANTGILYEWS